MYRGSFAPDAIAPGAAWVPSAVLGAAICRSTPAIRRSLERKLLNFLGSGPFFEPEGLVGS